jgi:hypothetical protein
MQSLSFKFLLFLLFGFQVSCVTVELPASNTEQGDWQRPLDLHLQIDDEDTPEKEGSLQDLKVQIICGEWTTDANHFRVETDSTCLSLEKKFIKYNAKILDGEESESGEVEKPDLVVRYLRSPTESVGCGIYGWASYMTFWLIPCKGYEWGEARLQFLDRDGAVLEQYPLTFRRRTLFGWSALLAKDQAFALQQEARIQMVKYIVNRTYTVAAKKKIIVVNR